MNPHWSTTHLLLMQGQPTLVGAGPLQGPFCVEALDSFVAGTRARDYHMAGAAKRDSFVAGMEAGGQSCD